MVIASIENGFTMAEATQPPVRIDVWSDYVCPFCFLVASSLEKLQQNYAVDIHWHAFLLQPPGTQWPPEKLAQIEAGRPMLEQMARDRYGLELNPGPLQANSLPAHTLEKYAETQGKGKTFHETAMKAYWQEAVTIDDSEVLTQLARKVGVEIEDINAIVQDEGYRQEVLADIQLAQEYGLHAVPALIFAEKYLISGAQPYELLQQVIERVQTEQ